MSQPPTFFGRVVKTSGNGRSTDFGDHAQLGRLGFRPLECFGHGKARLFVWRDHEGQTLQFLCLLLIPLYPQFTPRDISRHVQL